MSSEADMASAPSSKKGRSKKVEEDPVEEDVDEEKQQEEGSDEGEEEEYEIEKILKAKKDVFEGGSWGFFVKWKGYPDSENSWVNEHDFFATDLLEQFWMSHPEIKGNPMRSKINAMRTKSSVSQSNSRISTGRGRKSNVEAEASDNEPPKSSKRKAQSAAEEEEDEVEEVIETEPPKKKSRASQAKKKDTTPQHENGFFSGSEAQPHDLNAMQKHMNKKSWENIIETIETVERVDDGALMVYFTATDGTKGICDSTVLAGKAPQALIKFYETHLRWRTTIAN
ncbi:hypothetical protein FRB99_004443 [Tulasnella sp. 403]|nr:hypothetical protein FRB99_004443 [Tulasnella sp. 403]